ncbi:anthranilate phosphoribosyltransferase [Evansella caseinilytica]|uniref:Anthranilate phosphoribosyltransferase n=1 Tax=Evansella caseinilytica TaxID=1503961 RepID=A0A1H3NF28_9BACI|nr:anthranilate phosphoribosyltransferase [Evansella caseinilytica]SDY87270.1 anthranilate phosphoribosyltransferase [Evansella caseinilytica]
MNGMIEKLLSGDVLSEQEAKELVLTMLNGTVSDEQIVSILTILRYRGETVEEIVGFAKGMQEASIQIHPPFPVIDTCGTGGDGVGTFNISTAAAILLSSLSVPVAKHGNRGVSSKTGSADVLEYLDIPIQTTEQAAVKSLETYHLCFLFAPQYHSAMKHVGKARRGMGIKTIFNLLGPLTNPAGASTRLIGVYDDDIAKKMAAAAIALGIDRAMFVTGEDGLDELTITGKTAVVEVKSGELHEYELTPQEVGLPFGKLEPLLVASPEESAMMIEAVFQKKGPEEAENILLFNAGAALYLFGAVTSIAEGVHEAGKALGDPVMNQLHRLQTLNKGVIA